MTGGFLGAAAIIERMLNILADDSVLIPPSEADCLSLSEEDPALTPETPIEPVIVPAAETDPYAPHFVWGMWGMLSLAAVAFVAMYGSSVPRWEDWLHIPILTGEVPFTFGWLWEPVGGHRVPLLKALLYADLKCFGLNVRPMLFLNVGLFIGLAAILIRTIRHVRGRTVYADAFFAVVLLNVGLGDAFLWAQSFVYVSTAFCVGVVLSLLLNSGARLSSRAAAGAGICLTLLTLCFAGGLIYAVVLAIWLLGRGFLHLRDADQTHRAGGAMAVLFSASTLLIAACYFIDYHFVRLDTSFANEQMTIGNVAQMAVKFLSIGLGMAALPPVWPMSGWLMVLLVLVGFRAVAAAMSTPHTDKPRTLAAAWVLVGCLVVAGITGWGRLRCGTDYLFNSRYSALAAPTLITLYTLIEVAAPVAMRSIVRTSLFTLAVSCLMLNLRGGVALAQQQADEADAFLRDVRSRVSIPQLISRHALITCYYHEQLDHYLHLLRDHHVGDYANLPPDSVMESHAIDLNPSATQQVEWSSIVCKATGEQPFLTFDLPKPMRVAVLKIRYSNRNDAKASPVFRVYWKASRDGEFSPARSYTHFALPNDGTLVDVPIYLADTVGQIRIYPDKRPCEFRITSLTAMTEGISTGPVSSATGGK